MFHHILVTFWIFLVLCLLSYDTFSILAKQRSVYTHYFLLMLYQLGLLYSKLFERPSSYGLFEKGSCWEVGRINPCAFFGHWWHQ